MEGLVVLTLIRKVLVFVPFSPSPHLHFSIKHPHTLSWEYYKMFQCKAHLVMRLIENRISMEFMLQVRLPAWVLGLASATRFQILVAIQKVYFLYLSMPKHFHWKTTHRSSSKKKDHYVCLVCIGVISL